MAQFIDRDRGEKVSFLIPKNLFDLYKANAQKAKSLGYKLDFREDFCRWFAAEQKQVKERLEKVATQAKSGT